MAKSPISIARQTQLLGRCGLGFEFAWWYWFMGQINTLDPSFIAWCPRPLTGIQGLAMLLISLLLSKKLTSVSFRQSLDIPLSLCLAGASLLVGTPCEIGFIDTRCGLAIVLGGMGTAWCYIRWTSIYLRMNTRETFVSAFSCFAFSSLLKIVLWMLPSPLSLFVALLCVLAVFASIARLSRSLECASVQLDSITTYTASPSFTIKIFICLLVFSLVETVVPAAFVVATTASTTAAFLIEQGISVALSFAIIAWATKSRDELDLGVFWKWILGFIGALFTFVLVIPHYELYSILFHALFSVLWLFLWITLVNAARICTQSPYTFVGIGSALSWVPYSLGSIAIQSAELQSCAHVLLLISYIALSLTIIACMDSHDTDIRILFSTRAIDMRSNGSTTLEERCAALGKQFGLTERETEVLGYLCKGRSRTYIAETLFISESTVKAHIAHIYRKLNVSGKQELLSLVEAKFQSQ